MPSPLTFHDTTSILDTLLVSRRQLFLSKEACVKLQSAERFPTDLEALDGLARRLTTLNLEVQGVYQDLLDITD